MATKNPEQGPGRTSNQGRKEASGGEQQAASINTGSGAARGDQERTSRGGGSSRSASDKGSGEPARKTSVPVEKGK